MAKSMAFAFGVVACAIIAPPKGTSRCVAQARRELQILVVAWVHSKDLVHAASKQWLHIKNRR